MLQSIRRLLGLDKENNVEEEATENREEEEDTEDNCRAKCAECGNETFEHLSGGGGAEVWRCAWCGAIHNQTPFDIEYVGSWENYACKDMFAPPKKYSV